MVTTHRHDPGDDGLSTSQTGSGVGPAGSVGDDVPTVVLDSPAALPDGPAQAPDQTQRLDTAAPHEPLIDRAGDALARQPRQLWLRYTRLEEHQRGVVAALTALGVFLLLVALLGR